MGNKTNKSDTITIRIDPEDKQRMEAMAAAEALDLSAWIRQKLLLYVHGKSPDPVLNHIENIVSEMRADYRALRKETTDELGIISDSKPRREARGTQSNAS